MLSDHEAQVAQAYGAWGEKKTSGETRAGVIRSHFVIDEEGVIVDAQIKVSPEESVRKAVDAL